MSLSDLSSLVIGIWSLVISSTHVQWSSEPARRDFRSFGSRKIDRGARADGKLPAAAALEHLRDDQAAPSGRVGRRGLLFPHARAVRLPPRGGRVSRVQ